MRDQAVEDVLRLPEVRIGENLLQCRETVQVNLHKPLRGRTAQHAFVHADVLDAGELQPDVLAGARTVLLVLLQLPGEDVETVLEGDHHCLRPTLYLPVQQAALFPGTRRSLPGRQPPWSLST